MTKTTRLGTIATILFAGGGLTTSCDFIDSTFSQKQPFDNRSEQLLNIDIQSLSHSIEYEKKTMVFQAYVPNDLIAKTNDNQNSQILLSLEHKLEKVYVDTLGTVSMYWEYVNSSSNDTYPSDITEKFPNSFAEDSPEFPGTKSVAITDGKASYFDKDGNLLHKFEYDSSEIDSLISANDTNQTSPEESLAALEGIAVSANQLGDNLVMFEIEQDENEGNLFLAVDKFSGLVMREAVKAENGKFKWVSFNQYSLHNGIPIQASVETIFFDEIGKQWVPTQRILEQKFNITVTGGKR